MRLTFRNSQPMRIAAGQSMTISTPRLRQISVDDGDNGGFPLRGAAMESIYCVNPKVMFYVDRAGDTSLTALLPLKAEFQESSWDVVASEDAPVARLSAPNAKTTNVSADLVFTGGLCGGNLAYATVSSAALRLTNIGTAALQLRVRTEVYSAV